MTRLDVCNVCQPTVNALKGPLIGFDSPRPGIEIDNRDQRNLRANNSETGQANS
jgi:hypothetical protein